jgi:hypothetical protein
MFSLISDVIHNLEGLLMVTALKLEFFYCHNVVEVVYGGSIFN